MKKKLQLLAISLLFGSILLSTLPHAVQATVNPTAVGLTEFALRAWREGWGYVYGTFGQTVTQSLIDAKAGQYPRVYAEVMGDGRTAYEHAQTWIGRRAADCVGLIKAYLWWRDDQTGPAYTSLQDKSANGLYAAATIKGSIETLPETQGLLVWRDGHIGIYVGNGEVIESRGVEYGVIKTRLTDRNWTHWCQNPYLNYSASGWTIVDGQTFYYHGGVYLTGLQTIDGKIYLLGSDGTLQTGFHPIDSQLRFFRADGTALTGWQTIGGTRYYLDSNSAAATGWTSVDNQARLFSGQGVLLTGWQETGGAIYNLDAEGRPATGEQVIGSRLLTFGGNGRLWTGWQTDAGKTFYYALTGERLQGLQLISGRLYWFDESGARAGGWQTVDGNRYYFDPATGAALTGLQTIDGQTWLFRNDGSLQLSAGLFYNAGRICLSDANGQALSGRQILNGYGAGDPAPVPTALELAADYALKIRNQAEFALSQTDAALIDVSTGAATIQLTPDVAQPGARWLSLDPAVATVSADGLVTAAAPGRTVVLLLTSAGGYAGCQITVLPAPAGSTADSDPIRLEPGRSADLAVPGLPASLLEACSLASSDPGIAAVSANGRLTAVRSGLATITVRYGSQLVYSRLVQVQVPLLGLSAGQTVLQLATGATAATFAAPVPAAAGTAAIRYSSSDPAVAGVSSNGSIQGLAAGSAVITATAGDLQVNCQVQVAGSYPTLKSGSSGPQVLQLQQRLAELGYLTGPVDGLYGPLTEFGVSCFQRRMGLPLSGQADHNLQITLQKEAAPAATAVQIAGTLRSGDSGEAVHVLQQRLYELNFLKIKPDGQFQTHTRQVVATLLTVNGQAAAEQADPTTIALLYSRTVQAGQANLAPGDSGYEVLMLQTRLQELQYYAGTLDGQFTAEVETAVMAFQTCCGLTADGEAGPLTQGRLFAADAPARPAADAPAPAPEPVSPPAPAATPAPAPEPVQPVQLGQGSQGQAVLELEQRLIELGYHYATADIHYDSLTAQAVQTFQGRAGLPSTGIADQQTRNRLNAITAPRSAISFRYGSRGDAVYRIQVRLNQLGYNCGRPDSSFGSRTSAAAKAFQRSRGLTADGIVGSRTVAALFAGSTPAVPTGPAPAGRTVTAVPAASNATYRFGSSGEGVRQLQTRLTQLGYSCGSPDGRYGSLTVGAVKAFQRRSGLLADGIAGIRTQAALYSAAAPRAN